jgi:hypothetical protein
VRFSASWSELTPSFGRVVQSASLATMLLSKKYLQVGLTCYAVVLPLGVVVCARLTRLLRL